jgi:hypothetical protein
VTSRREWGVQGTSLEISSLDERYGGCVDGIDKIHLDMGVVDSRENAGPMVLPTLVDGKFE